MKITAAGNMLIDKIKMIESYPAEGMLAKIKSIEFAVGGCVPNTLIDLAKMEGGIELAAIGRIGNDEDGRYILGELTRNGIDIGGIVTDENLPTSFTDVMTDIKNGHRTFFYNSGASGKFSVNDVVIETLNCDIFHAGYLLLLESLDAGDSEYGTMMARLLANVQKKGIKTSIDVVSDSSGRFKDTVTPTLKYCDYVIINEIEAGRVAEIEPRDENGKLCKENVRLAMKKLLSLGVKDSVIVHSEEGGFLLNSREEFYYVPSLLLPPGYIIGSVGAGDAFCAGCLYGIAKEFNSEEILSYANAAAACNLSAADSVSGMRAEKEVRNLQKELEKAKGANA